MTPGDSTAARSAESGSGIPVEEHRPTASALPYDQHARNDFTLLPYDQQLQTIRRLHARGYGDHSISDATGLSVEYVRRLLGEHEARK